MDPLESIEQAHGRRSLGALGVEVYRGALEQADGDVDLAHAGAVVMLEALFRSGRAPDDDEQRD